MNCSEQKIQAQKEMLEGAIDLYINGQRLRLVAESLHGSLKRVMNSEADYVFSACKGLVKDAIPDAGDMWELALLAIALELRGIDKNSTTDKFGEIDLSVLYWQAKSKALKAPMPA